MLVIKHLARDFDLEPYDLRRAFRDAGLKPDNRRRWRWEDENDKGYIAARAIAQKLKSKQNGKDTSS